MELHSIEQPIKPGQTEAMAELCEQTLLPIALDEELIGVFDVTNKLRLLQTIKPQYIILKPSLIGGFASSKEWISMLINCNLGDANMHLFPFRSTFYDKSIYGQYVFVYDTNKTTFAVFLFYSIWFIIFPSTLIDIVFIEASLKKPETTWVLCSIREK